MRVAFATCAEIPGGTEDDRAAARLLDAEFPVWSDPAVDWSAFDRVVVRSVWDYSWRLDEFLEWSREVGTARLRNAPEVVAFNADKRYLAELTVPTVPTAFLEPGAGVYLPAGEVVLKPSISAGARDTGRFADEPGARREAEELIAQIHASGRTVLVQPYMKSVDERGETSIVFFGGRVSHVLHKKPVLRGQGLAPVGEDFMGVAAVMRDPDLVTPGVAGPSEHALADALHEELVARFGPRAILFARVDMIRGDDGGPLLSEVELIEPALYLASTPGAAERLAAAVRAG